MLIISDWTQTTWNSKPFIIVYRQTGHDAVMYHVKSASVKDS